MNRSTSTGSVLFVFLISVSSIELQLESVALQRHTGQTILLQAFTLGHLKSTIIQKVVNVVDNVD